MNRTGTRPPVFPASTWTSCNCVAVMACPSRGESTAQTSRRIRRTALDLLATVTRPLTALDCGTQYSLETSMLGKGEYSTTAKLAYVRRTVGGRANVDGSLTALPFS